MNRIMTLMNDQKVIDIYVECYWELRDETWEQRKVLDREYVGKYHGGYTVIKCPGFPSINGGMGTPDMMSLYPNPDAVRQKFIKEYSEKYPEHKIKIHLKVTKDDRNPTMDNFFG